MIIFYSNLKLYLYILKLLPNLFVVHQSQESLMIHESSNRQASIHQIWCVGTNEHVQYVHQLLHIIWTWTVFVLNIWAMENSVVQVYKGSYCPIICWLKETVKEKGSLWNNQYNECQRFFSWLIMFVQKTWHSSPRFSELGSAVPLRKKLGFSHENVSTADRSRVTTGVGLAQLRVGWSKYMVRHGCRAWDWIRRQRLEVTALWTQWASSWLREVSLWRMW